MTDSLSHDQNARIQKLGTWRDEGHCLAVARYGEVSIQPANDGDHHEATQQREGAARRQGPSGRQGAAGQSGAAASPEPARKDGSTDVRAQYLAAMPEIEVYYPDLRVIEVEDGIWVVTQIFPIGRDGPYFSVCLFLSDDKTREAKAFAFVGNGAAGEPVGIRHTNFPDASICAFCADDGVWKPGQSPHILLDLYAEWLLCHLFLQQEEYWPGRQWGDHATYRQSEFKDGEWCFCEKGLRYGDCHAPSDAREVARLKHERRYKNLPTRRVPRAVLNFAKSGWESAPPGGALKLCEFMTQIEGAILMNRLRRSRPFVRPLTPPPKGVPLRPWLLASTS